MRKTKLITLITTMTLAAVGAVSLSVSKCEKPVETKATDYSSTIRVYVDLNWGGINEIAGQVGSNDTWGSYSSTSGLDTGSSHGNYYKDGKSSSNLTIINLYFKQDNSYWHPFDSSDDWNRDNSKIYGTFKPGYMYKITNINYKQDGWGGEHKWFTYSVTEIGKLPEANPATVNLHVLNRTVAVQHGSLTESYTPDYIFYSSDKDGYYFDGWYEDINYTKPYSPKVLPAESTVDLYAKFTEFSTIDVYINFFDWDSNVLGVYSEESINGVTYGKNYNVTLNDGQLFFNGSNKHHLQKVTLQASKVSELKMNYYTKDGKNNSEVFTNIQDGSYFYHNSSNWVEMKAGATDGYADAAKFVYDLNTARLAVNKSGDIKAFSICGLVAKDWVDRYDDLSANARALVDDASIFTYKDQSSTGADSTCTFGEVISQLRLISGSNSTKGFKFLNLNLFGNVAEETNNSTMLTVMILTIAGIAAVGGLFFYKKRKEN